MKIWLGFLFGLFAVSHWSTYAYAWELKAVTAGERMGSVFIGAAILVLILFLIYKRYNSSFFRGFLAAIGLFFTVDNILFHWIFQLHRMTSGPESDILEPLFVLIGVVLVYSTYRLEKESP